MRETPSKEDGVRPALAGGPPAGAEGLRGVENTPWPQSVGSTMRAEEKHGDSLPIDVKEKG